MRSKLVVGIGTLVLAAAANATAILGPDNATPLASGNFNTGITVNTGVSTGSYFDAGQATPVATTTNQDQYWTYLFENDGGANTQHLALVTTDPSNAFYSGPPAWVADGTTTPPANWVGLCDCVNVDENSTTAFSDYISYSIGFNVPGSISLLNASITLDWAASVQALNSYAEVFVNGQVVTGSEISGATGYDQLTSFTISNAALFNTSGYCNACIVPNANTLSLRLFNVDPNTTQNGVIVAITNASTQGGGPPTTTPEPGSAALVLTGVVAVVAGVRRRKRN
jgi:hypothetical protein